MPAEMWNSENCVECNLFPGACPYMGPKLKALLCAAVEKIGGEEAKKVLQEQKNQRCEGDCEACTLEDWMKNC